MKSSFSPNCAVRAVGQRLLMPKANEQSQAVPSQVTVVFELA